MSTTGGTRTINVSNDCMLEILLIKLGDAGDSDVRSRRLVLNMKSALREIHVLSVKYETEDKERSCQIAEAVRREVHRGFRRIANVWH